MTDTDERASARRVFGKKLAAFHSKMEGVDEDEVFAALQVPTQSVSASSSTSLTCGFVAVGNQIRRESASTRTALSPEWSRREARMDVFSGT
jgi:hypothetical protein